MGGGKGLARARPEHAAPCESRSCSSWRPRSTRSPSGIPNPSFGGGDGVVEAPIPKALLDADGSADPSFSGDGWTVLDVAPSAGTTQQDPGDVKALTGGSVVVTALVSDATSISSGYAVLASDGTVVRAQPWLTGGWNLRRLALDGDGYALAAGAHGVRSAIGRIDLGVGADPDWPAFDADLTDHRGTSGLIDVVTVPGSHDIAAAAYAYEGAVQRGYVLRTAANGGNRFTIPLAGIVPSALTAHADGGLTVVGAVPDGTARSARRSSARS
jgi:hypothetical protein